MWELFVDFLRTHADCDPPLTAEQGDCSNLGTFKILVDVTLCCTACHQRETFLFDWKDNYRLVEYIEEHGLEAQVLRRLQ